MRRALLPALALAALASCTVDVEGAACTTPGSTASCPAGQACGTGLTCSTQAASCSPCTVGEVGCFGGNVATCSADGDPACGTRTVTATCQTGLQTCQVPPGGSAACVCATWVVDPGAAGATCTKPSITAAINEAVRLPAPVVRLGGAAPTTYGNELDDAAPIVIPAGVTLIGDDAASAATTNRIIAVQGPGPEGLQVHPGAVVRGVAVQLAAAGPAVGVLLTGGPGASGNTLVSVRVEPGGGGAFATGLRIAGGNAVAVNDVVVRGATVAGLEVNRLSATDVVVVSGSTFDQNQVGVSLLKGDLTLAGTTVKRSVAEGVVSATGTTGLTGLTMQDGLVSWNGTAGLVLSANDKLVIQRTRVCRNVGSDRGPTVPQRKVGGIFVVGSQPTVLTFAGNWLHDNGGDQFYVLSGGLWNLSGASSCTAGDRNVFANYTAPGVGVAAVGASTLNALFNYWGNPLERPVAGTDFLSASGGTVDAGTGGAGTSYCLHDPPADLTCPAP